MGDENDLITEPAVYHCAEALKLANGDELPSFDLVYETYGELDKKRSNAVLICHALSSDHHVTGVDRKTKRPGWWSNYVGPGKAIDTNQCFVVCANNIGGCSGSTGPNTENPQSGKLWENDFPSLRVRDWVECQWRLMRELGIEQWAAVIGGSLGGMQVLRWSLEHPQAMRHCIVIASSMKLTAQNIAFNEIARRAITSDPDFCDGRYLSENKLPKRGLALARMVGHVTYLSGDQMASRFGRELQSGNFEIGKHEEVEFAIESYLGHQGEKFAMSFDANTYLLMLQALDYFDLAREYDNDPAAAFANADAEFLIIAFSSDWRFSPERSREIVDALCQAGRAVSYVGIDSTYGHDAFLLPDERNEAVLSAYMRRVIES